VLKFQDTVLTDLLQSPRTSFDEDEENAIDEQEHLVANVLALGRT
jgi:hypothetical protein